MALSSLFFSAGAKILKGALTIAKDVLSAASKSLFSKFIYGGIMIAASALTSRSLLSSQKGTASSPTYQNFKYTQTNPDLPLPIIYGTVQTAGNLIWQNAQEKFSQKIIAFAEGEITEFSDIRINDIPISEIKGAKAEKFYGTENQLIAAVAPGASQLDKAANVGSLKNVAYLALTVFNDEKITSNYNLTTVIKGKKIRVYTSETNYTIKYSENPAWVLFDFLTAYNGLGLALDADAKVDDNLISTIFDMQSFLESAAFCDELVDGVKRFTFNMIFDSQTNARSLLDEIYRSCRGGLFLKNGQLQFKIDKAEHISKIFTADDISNEVFKAVPSEELYDILKLVYISPQHEWQKVEAFAEIPEYRNGAPVENSVSVFSCTNFEQASRLAWYYSNSKVLQPYFGSFDTDYRAYDLEVGDVIKFDSLLMGLNGYKAKVTQITDDGAGTYTINWQTYDERLYADKKGSLEPRVLVTKLNDLYKYPEDVRNFNVVQNQNSFNFVWQLNDNPNDTYEIRIGKSWEEGKIIASNLKADNYSCPVESVGLYSFWIKAFNQYNYSQNPASDILSVQNIPQMNVVVNWDLIGEDNLFMSESTPDNGNFQNCYIYHHILKPVPQTQWINPVEKAIESGIENTFEVVYADDFPQEYYNLENEFINSQNEDVFVFKSDNFNIVGSPSISETRIASGFNFANKVETTIFNASKKNYCIKLSNFEYKGGQTFVFGTLHGVNYFSFDIIFHNQKTMLFLSSDGITWDIASHVSGHSTFTPNTKYDISFIRENGNKYKVVVYNHSTNVETIEIEIETDEDLFSSDINNKIYIGSVGGAWYPYTGSIDLNEFSIYIDGDLVYQPCFVVPCKVTSDGNYIADVKYRNKIKEIFEQGNGIDIYTIDTENKNFTRVCSKYSNCYWNSWEKSYIPPYETKDNKWGTDISQESIFISNVFNIGKVLESSVSIELETDNSDILSNSVLCFWRYSSNNEDWTDFTIFNSGQYIFRYAQFKIILNCPKSQYISIKTAKITVDVPDKTAVYQICVDDAENGFYLDYSDKRFVNIPTIVATVTNSISAYAVTTDKTALGAKIFAINNNGSKTTGIIDLQIKGY